MTLIGFASNAEGVLCSIVAPVLHYLRRKNRRAHGAHSARLRFAFVSDFRLEKPQGTMHGGAPSTHLSEEMIGNGCRCLENSTQSAGNSSAAGSRTGSVTVAGATCPLPRSRKSSAVTSCSIPRNSFLSFSTTVYITTIGGCVLNVHVSLAARFMASCRGFGHGMHDSHLVHLLERENRSRITSIARS